MLTFNTYFFDTCHQAFTFKELLLNSFNDVSYKTGYFSTKVINISWNSHQLDADIADAMYKINFETTVAIGLMLCALWLVGAHTEICENLEPSSICYGAAVRAVSQ